MSLNHQEKQEQMQFEELIQGLIDNEYGCCNDFILPETVMGLGANIKRLNESGNMKPAGIGNQVISQKDSNIRGDKINWIEELSSNAFEAVYINKMVRFINHLNKTCFTSIKGFESHYANYGLKSFYKRHFDQFKTEKGRKYSLVLYLNKDWNEKDGGLLSLYPEGGEQKDISPLGGRMVFFKSDEMEHEVFPSFTRERISIAGWLKN